MLIVFGTHMGRSKRSGDKVSPTVEMNDQKKNKPLIDDESLQSIISALNSKNTEGMEQGRVLSDIDTTDLGSIMKHLLSALAILTKKVQVLEEKASIVNSEDSGSRFESQMRAQIDYTDEIKQRSLKGNLILSSASVGGRKSVILSEKDLSDRKMLLIDHIIDLIGQKYNVLLPKEDIQACHRLPNGSVILWIWRRTEDSAWASLVNAIKRGLNPEFNFYANFHLTKRRNDLAYDLRQLRKSGKIVKYYTDENGSISFKLKESSNKCRITFFKDKNSTSEKTYLKTELLELINIGT